MLNQETAREYWNSEIWIARLYLYLLPIRMIAPLIFLRNIIPGAAVYFDLVLHGLGLLLIFMRTRGRAILDTDPSSKLMQHFAFLIVYLNFSSIIMSVVIQYTRGNYAGESAFSGIVGMLLYFTQYAFMLFYNKHVFEMISKEELLTILRRVCWFLLILGYWQVMAMSFGGAFAAIHDAFDIFDVLYSAEEMPKLCLTGSEGASAGSIISIFVLPVLYGCILGGNKSALSFVQVLLWLVPLYFTRSSTAYILFAVVSIFFLFLWIKESAKKHPAALVLVVIFLLLIVLILILFEVSVFSDEVVEQIQYLLMEKITDEKNGSTISRTVPLVVNWKTFLRYPIFGVGNGLQGYFYVEDFPKWAMNVPGSDVMEFYEISKYGISNGAVFFPSLLSGYGIVGVVMIIIFAVHLVMNAISGKKQMGSFYYTFLLAAVAILFTGFQGDIYGSYYIWFMLSLPLMVKGAEDNKSCEEIAEI